MRAALELGRVLDASEMLVRIGLNAAEAVVEEAGLFGRVLRDVQCRMRRRPWWLCRISDH